MKNQKYPKFTCKDILNLTQQQLTNINLNNGIKLANKSFKQYLEHVYFYLNNLSKYYLKHESKKGNLKQCQKVNGKRKTHY